MNIYYCTLTTHDFLSFASYDVAKITITENIIHNYALTYAIHYETAVLDRIKKPTYEKDLSKMTKFPTPAIMTNNKSLMKQTYNVIDEATLKTQTQKGVDFYTPDFGVYYKLPPGSKFNFYLINLEEKQAQRRLIRLGKKSCLCSIEYTKLQNIQERETKDTTVKISHPVNPIDLEGKIKSYDQIIFIPPSPIVIGANITGKYFQAQDHKGNKHTIAFSRWIKNATTS